LRSVFTEIIIVAATFSRTLRAVEADGARRWTLQLSAAMIMLGVWGAWFLLGRLTANRLNPHKWVQSEAI
jgi:hypothetical protein